MKDMPKVSVIIPVKNMAHMICDAVNSILAQEFKDYEIVVVDDCSTDGLPLAVSKYQNSGILKIVNGPGNGLAGARNTGINAACGEYIAFLDADDQWLPGMLKELVPVLDGNKDVTLVCCDALKMRKDGEIKGRWSENRTPYSGCVYRQLLFSCFIVSSSVLVRKCDIEKAELFDRSINVNYCVDHDCWMKLSVMGNIIHINKPLLIYRIPEGRDVDVNWFRAQIMILSSYPSKFKGIIYRHDPIFLLALSAQRLKCINFYLKRKHYLNAFKDLIHHVAEDPISIFGMTYLLLKRALFGRIY